MSTLTIALLLINGITWITGAWVTQQALTAMVRKPSTPIVYMLWPMVCLYVMFSKSTRTRG